MDDYSTIPIVDQSHENLRCHVEYRVRNIPEEDEAAVPHCTHELVRTSWLSPT